MKKRGSQEKAPSAPEGEKAAPKEPVPTRGLLRCKIVEDLEDLKTRQNGNMPEREQRVQIPYDTTSATGFAEEKCHKELVPQFMPVGIANIKNIEEALLLGTKNLIQGLIRIGPKTYFPFMKFEVAVMIRVDKGPIDLKSPKNIVIFNGQPAIKNVKLEEGEERYFAKGVVAAFDNWDDTDKVLKYTVCFPKQVPKNSIQNFRLVTAKSLNRQNDRPNAVPRPSPARSDVNPDEMVPFLARKKSRNVNDSEQKGLRGATATTEGISPSVETVRHASEEPQVFQQANGQQRQPPQASRTPRREPSVSEASGSTLPTRMKFRAMKVTETNDQTVTEVVQVQGGPGIKVKLTSPKQGGPWDIRASNACKHSTKRSYSSPEPEEPERKSGPRSKERKMPSIVVKRSRCLIRSNVLSRSLPQRSAATSSGSDVVIISGTTATDEILSSTENVISKSSNNGAEFEPDQTADSVDERETNFVGLQVEDFLMTSDSSDN